MLNEEKYQDYSFEIWFCDLSISEQVMYRLTGCTTVKEYLWTLWSRFCQSVTGRILKS